MTNVVNLEFSADLVVEFVSEGKFGFSCSGMSIDGEFSTNGLVG